MAMSAFIRATKDDPMPRPGESELERIVRCYGVEKALDILEEGAIEDGIVSTIRIDGQIWDTDDPMFDPLKTLSITKTFKTSDLPATRARWDALGRTITNVIIVNS